MNARRALAGSAGAPGTDFLDIDVGLADRIADGLLALIGFLAELDLILSPSPFNLTQHDQTCFLQW
jgi:hypothetical protein